MSSAKQYRLAEQAIARQQRVVAELAALVKSVERCEKTIVELKSELEGVNVRHQGRKTTQEDIAYLTDLLKCAHRKLSWEKQLASLKKRTPVLLEGMAEVMNDPKNPPTEETRGTMMGALQSVQAAIERLEKAQGD
jgi:hypothetical protein